MLSLVYFKHYKTPLGALGMKDLVQRLMAEGLTEEQAYKAIEVIKNFTKEKFPLFGGAIDKLFDKYSPRDEEDFMP
jgi:hypothetical protein